MARNLHAEISARIIEALRAGVVPWRKNWTAQGAGQMPRNAVTKRTYSGVNVPLLWLTADAKGYTSPLWLTFKQALDQGGNVRKGEKGTTVVFVSTIEREDRETGKPVRIPFLKAYTVFNVAQCDGLAILDASAPIQPRHEDARDPLADAFLASTGATITHGEGRAYYRPREDRVNLPAFESFESASAYYATAFHELTHWTGAPTRLNREAKGRFGDRDYAVEELVAELGAAFLCAEFGFDNAELDQSASYIASWIKLLEDHERAFTAAASAASRAVDYMRGLAIAEADDAAQLAEAA